MTALDKLTPILPITTSTWKILGEDCGKKPPIVRVICCITSAAFVLIADIFLLPFRACFYLINNEQNFTLTIAPLAPNVSAFQKIAQGAKHPIRFAKQLADGTVQSAQMTTFSFSEQDKEIMGYVKFSLPILHKTLVSILPNLKALKFSTEDLSESLKSITLIISCVCAFFSDIAFAAVRLPRYLLTSKDTQFMLPDAISKLFS